MKPLPITSLPWLTKPQAPTEHPSHQSHSSHALNSPVRSSTRGAPIIQPTEPAPIQRAPCAKQAPPIPPPEEPSVLEMAANLGSALATWASAGFPVATAEQAAAHGAICAACEKWQPGARLGLGKCTSKKCGCTKLKWWLKTSKCPEGKW